MSRKTYMHARRKNQRHAKAQADKQLHSPVDKVRLAAGKHPACPALLGSGRR